MKQSYIICIIKLNNAMYHMLHNQTINLDESLQLMHQLKNMIQTDSEGWL